MNAHPGSSAAPDGFAFVQQLAADLTAGTIDLPAFPDVVLRVRRALQDERVSAAKLTLVIGAEPALTLRLLQIANSAAVNLRGEPVTDLRTAITRIGFDLVRTSAIAFAMAQLHKNESLKSIRVPLNRLWQRSALVAAMAQVLARHVGHVNADSAALAGMLHGMGRLYILVNASAYPELFADQAEYRRIEQQWHTEIAKALLENWSMSEEIVAAVHHQADLDYAHEGEPDLTDVLILADILVQHREQPAGSELVLEGVQPAAHVNLDAAALERVLVESDTEIAALRAALAG